MTRCDNCQHAARLRRICTCFDSFGACYGCQVAYAEDHGRDNDDRVPMYYIDAKIWSVEEEDA